MKAYKRILIQLFFVLFVTETFGIYKYVHFCGDEKTSESFFIEKNSCCCGEDEDESDGCCTDQTAVMQLKEDGTLVPDKIAKTPGNIGLNLFYLTSFNEVSFSGSHGKTVSAINETGRGSPLSTPLIIKHRTLLI